MTCQLVLPIFTINYKGNEWPSTYLCHFWEATIRPHDSRNCDQESVEASRLFERS